MACFFAIALVIVNGLTVMLPVYISRNNIYVILVTLVWGCYIDGHIGKTVAKSWREPREEKQFESSYE